MRGATRELMKAIQRVYPGVAEIRLDLNTRLHELPRIDPILPRWWRCWSIVDARCPDFDSIARLGVATVLYNTEGYLTSYVLQKQVGVTPTIVRCGLAFIQRSS